MRLVIVGATGGTGRHLLEQTVADGHDVMAVVRSPEKLSVEVPAVEMDMADPDVPRLADGFEKADAVLSALGPRSNAEAGVASTGTRAVIAAMEEAQVQRLLVISSESMTTIPSPGRPHPPKHDPGEGFLLRYVIGPPARWLLRHQYRDLGLMEDAIRESGLDWTIVRPALLIDQPLTGTYRTALDEKPRGGFKIGRADLAHFMLQTIDRPETVGHHTTITY